MCRKINNQYYNKIILDVIIFTVLLVHLNALYVSIPDLKENKGHLCLHSKAFGLLPGSGVCWEPVGYL